MLGTTATAHVTCDIARSAATIGKSAKQLAQLVQSLVDLRSVELEGLGVRLEPVDLHALVIDCLVDLAYLTESHRLEVDVPDGLVLTADPVRVRQVLVNLLTNAVKFAPAGTAIHVAATDGDVVRLTVSDEGPGIPADRIAELFGKFARLGSMHKGTGIGLYLSRAIARAHGGDLVLTANDGGATFELALPRRGPA